MKFYLKNAMFMAATCIMLYGCASKTESAEKAPIQVKVMTVAKSGDAARQSFSGTIEEQNGSSLSFPTAGTVKSVAVAEGQRVNRGQLIAILDDATFQSSYNMAKATLDQATDAYNRLKILHDSNSLPEIQWVEAESKLKQAQSAFDIAKKNVSDTKLYAPFSGYISEKNVEVGNNVMPGSPVVKLVTVDNVKVCIDVPETEISKIRQGDNIEITVPALNGQSFTGSISEKGVAANPLSRAYRVKAEIKNQGNALLPGMLCTLYITNASSDQAVIAVARHVVQLDSDNNNFVWLNIDAKAEKRIVTLGQFIGDKVEITAGLAEGDQIVVEGQQKISNGMSLTIIE